MSATLDEELVAGYFDNCPIVHIPGRMYPVQLQYLDDALRAIARNPVARPRSEVVERIEPFVEETFRQKKQLGKVASASIENTLDSTDIDANIYPAFDASLVANLVRVIVKESEVGGAVLVFLSGIMQIRQVEAELKRLLKRGTENSDHDMSHTVPYLSDIQVLQLMTNKI
jgi:HrpA-like RNA helicase